MSRAQTNRLQCHAVLIVAQKCHTWPLNNTKWESSLWRVWYLFWGLCNTYMVTCCYQKIDSVKQYFPVWVCLHLVADYLGVWEKQDRNSALTMLHHACVLHCAYTAQIQRGCQWKFCISFLRVQRNWEKYNMGIKFIFLFRSGGNVSWMSFNLKRDIFSCIYHSQEFYFCIVLFFFCEHVLLSALDISGSCRNWN